MLGRHATRCFPRVAGIAVFAVHTTGQTRLVQFRKTTEMNTAINSGKKAADKWVTKSTADYAAKTDTAVAAGVLASDGTSRSMAARTTAATNRATEMMAWSDAQVSRISDFNTARRRRYASFSMRYGWTFLVVYIVVYFFFLGTIWLILRWGLIDMLSFFEATYCLMSGHIDRPAFFETLEEWGDWTNLGFAFLLNEALDVVRVPMTIALWWTFRRGLIRAKTNTVFRWNSTEYDVELRRVQRSCDEAGRRAVQELEQKELQKKAASSK